MSAKPTPRIRMSDTAKAGEVMEIKTLISHPMETGLRKDSSGKPIPRQIIKQFVVKFDGQEVMRADWHPAVSANPYHAFFVRVPKTGTFEFSWHDDNGEVYKAERKVTVK